MGFKRVRRCVSCQFHSQVQRGGGLASTHAGGGKCHYFTCELFDLPQSLLTYCSGPRVAVLSLLTPQYSLKAYGFVILRGVCLEEPQSYQNRYNYALGLMN